MELVYELEKQKKLKEISLRKENKIKLKEALETWKSVLKGMKLQEQLTKLDEQVKRAEIDMLRGDLGARNMKESKKKFLVLKG